MLSNELPGGLLGFGAQTATHTTSTSPRHVSATKRTGRRSPRSSISRCRPRLAAAAAAAAA
eukprot:CAMPEP_0177409208 /NCGR_PEP_ID=MMETSP0368-20130122/64118_1 /TAXON_ID=447022 ORGANISM="Scrippsiella hangoei-like, Strain SHHI-4" /NCGR_SAMPLE_ID=MMETSP0368 /ASSEMBLY_ACC=CAM_ASM_000363 /LENGTH=60 /DNA_ID=CAMNT_0018877955 /DNA_START=42 /DNA_END=221 /DNA_ORIENTATION=-